MPLTIAEESLHEGVHRESFFWGFHTDQIWGQLNLAAHEARTDRFCVLRPLDGDQIYFAIDIRSRRPESTAEMGFTCVEPGVWRIQATLPALCAASSADVALAYWSTLQAASPGTGELDADLQGTAALKGAFKGKVEPAEIELDLAYHDVTPAVAVRWDFLGVPQTHYQADGNMTGKMKVDGQTYTLDDYTTRDHSWGKREWDRTDYWLFGMFSAPDGARIHVVRSGSDDVQDGFWWHPDGRLERIVAVNVPQLELLSTPPKGVESTTFEIRTENGREATLRTQLRDNFHFTVHVADGRICRDTETLSAAQVNGEPWEGVLEYGYNFNLPTGDTHGT